LDTFQKIQIESVSILPNVLVFSLFTDTFGLAEIFLTKKANVSNISLKAIQKYPFE